MAVVIAPLVIAGYVVGMPYGPQGVAFGYSAVMIALVAPMVAWAAHRSVVSGRELLSVVSPPLLSSVAAAVLALAVRELLSGALSPVVRLGVEASVLLASYSCAMLYSGPQRAFYIGLIRDMFKGSSNGP